MFLAIDLGSTSFKAAVFDAGLRRLAAGRAALCCIRGPGNLVELEAGEVERAFQTAVRATLKDSGSAQSAIQAVGITSQAQTFAILDPQGAPRTRFISWQDGRAAEACAALGQLPGFADFGDHASFGELLPALQVCQLRRLRDERTGLVRPGDLVAGLPAFFVRRLTGEFRTDQNLAAMSGLYSLPLAGWSPEALAGCGLDARQLPEVLPIGAVAGRTAAAAGPFGLAAGIPLVLAGNDQTAGAYGARVGEADRVLLTLGTAHVAYACRARPPERRPGLIRGPYPGGQWYAMRADSCGGNVVDWVRRELGCGESPGEFLALAEQSPPGSRGVAFDPEEPAGPGRWRDRAGRGRADLARAVLESLAGRAAELVRELAAGRSGVEVLAAGGGSRGALLPEMIAGLLGRPVRATDADALLGAALLAREGLAAR